MWCRSTRQQALCLYRTSIPRRPPPSSETTSSSAAGKTRSPTAVQRRVASGEVSAACTQRHASNPGHGVPHPAGLILIPPRTGSAQQVLSVPHVRKSSPTADISAAAAETAQRTLQAPGAPSRRGILVLSECLRQVAHYSTKRRVLQALEQCSRRTRMACALTSARLVQVGEVRCSASAAGAWDASAVLAPRTSQGGPSPRSSGRRISLASPSLRADAPLEEQTVSSGANSPLSPAQRREMLRARLVSPLRRERVISLILPSC